MKFLTSLLEYSSEQLQDRLDKIKNNEENFLNLQYPMGGEERIVNLHLDFVMKYFAQDRKVMQSMDVVTVLDIINKNFGDQKLELTVHLMGLEEDLGEAYKALDDYKFNPNWSFEVYVPEKYLDLFKGLDSLHDSIVGAWYDLDEWQAIDFVNIADHFLMMSVLAGKSGQKLTTEIRSLLLSLAEQNPTKEFILDGGWGVDLESDLKNLRVVSYSSFWKKFDDIIS